MRAEARVHPEAGGYAALDEDARWHRGLLRLPYLDDGEGDQKHQGEYKQGDDTILAPLDTVSSTGSKQQK